MLHIVADSSCDLPADLLDRHGIQTVPLSVDIDGQHFREGLDITPREFYAKMARSTDLPTTAQPSPAVFAEKFQALAASGPVLCVTISSKLSGTFESATLGAELSGVDVTIFDSLTASIGLGLQLLRAAELAEAGRTVLEIVAELTRYRGEMTTLVLLNTLENIVKGGRLSRFQGGVSKLLDIRVLLRDDEGEVVVLEKVHGHHKLLDRAVATAKSIRPDLSDRDVGITHFNNPDDAEYLRQSLAEQCHARGFVINEMGPTMSTYAGEGGLILSF